MTYASVECWLVDKSARVGCIYFMNHNHIRNMAKQCKSKLCLIELPLRQFWECNVHFRGLVPPHPPLWRDPCRFQTWSFFFPFFLFLVISNHFDPFKLLCMSALLHGAVGLLWNHLLLSLTGSFSFVVQAAEVLQHTLHGNLLRPFKLSSDTVSQHTRDQRSPEAGQRRRTSRGCRCSHRRDCHSSDGEKDFSLLVSPLTLLPDSCLADPK